MVNKRPPGLWEKGGFRQNWQNNYSNPMKILCSSDKFPKKTLSGNNFKHPPTYRKTEQYPPLCPTVISSHMRTTLRTCEPPDKHDKDTCLPDNQLMHFPSPNYFRWCVPSMLQTTKMASLFQESQAGFGNAFSSLAPPRALGSAMIHLDRWYAARRRACMPM
jgi:hypothetical protein